MEKLTEITAEELQIISERLELCMERVSQLREEYSHKASLDKENADNRTESDVKNGNLEDYFDQVFSFVELLEDTRLFLEKNSISASISLSLEELAERNHRLYEDILPDHYETSYVNPSYAVTQLGEELGQLLSALYYELRFGIAFLYEGELEEYLIRLELLLEVYSAYQSSLEDERPLKAKEVHDILYWFVSDYAQDSCLRKVRNMVCPGHSLMERILKTADLSDPRYLYFYGEYITENELQMVEFLNGLPREELQKMADTFTEGYRIGFVMTGKDLSKKKTADLRFPVGFEAMARIAMDNLEKLNLKCVLRRPNNSLLYGPGQGRLGVISTNPNRQMYYDHRNDRALILDKNYVNRLLESQKEAFDCYKGEALGYAGPAVVESFGEPDFNPEAKKEAVAMTPELNKLQLELTMKLGSLTRKYILEEERSFTIIAFPVPDIIPALNPPTKERFAEFFREIIKVNTLDYTLYQGIQKTIIDALNQADYCEIKGMNGNRTDLKVNLYKLTDPEKQTIFENCVADVNIPVGEVFTSPVLSGTEGVLHVTKVFLNGLEFRDLELTFKEGKITSYSCGNFETKEDNKTFIEENILFRHESLPMGEFAIGTNTTAYVVAREFGVESKLPILIAEKTGPHFAVGDTCYSGAEDIPVFNPDGKEIVARDNEISILRKTDESKAYFNCHTDITIPYEELGSLCAVKKNGEKIGILEGGRFILPGTEELNIPLQNE